LRAAVAGDESEYQTVLAIKKSAGEILPAIQAEIDRREAEANKE
jgi:Na+-transporting NADH:ubiquinone oxidoreductase subunit NqrF